MIGDFEYTINQRTPKQDIRDWYTRVSNSGCSVEFVAKNPFPNLQSTWRHLDFGNVCINYIYNSTPFTALHDPDLSEKNRNRNFKLVYTDIATTLNHCRRHTHVPADSFFLMDNSQLFEFDIEARQSTGISLNLDASWLLKYIPNPRLSVCSHFSARQGWGEVLLKALRTIEKQQNPEDTIPRSLVAEQLGSLLSLLILPTDGAALESRHQISLYNQLNRILHDNYHMADLDAATVAGRAGISRRHLFSLYAKAGKSFNHTLLQIRLESARKMLADNRYKTFRICDIAWASGFSDLSHFNRSFKEEFRQTPTSLRKSLMKQGLNQSVLN